MTKEETLNLFKKTVAAFIRMNGLEFITADDLEIVWFGAALKDCKALVRVAGDNNSLYAIGYDFYNKTMKIETLFEKGEKEE